MLQTLIQVMCPQTFWTPHCCFMLSHGALDTNKRPDGRRSGSRVQMSPVTAEQQCKNTLLYDPQSELDHRQPCKRRVCLLAMLPCIL